VNEDQGHARKQARINAEVAVSHAEEDPQVAASVAIAWALLDIADAIREAAEYAKDDQ